MIRVAIICGPLHSGGKRNLIMEYYRHIDHYKFQYDFICDANSNGIPKEEIESLGGKVYIVPPYKDLIAHQKATYKILKDNKYQIMHAFDNTLNIFSMYEGKKAGVKVRISESISKGDKHEKKTILKQLLRPFSRCFATHFMANSIDCGIWQFGKNIYYKGRISIFKTVIDADKNSYDARLREKTRTEYGWSDKVVYGFIGRYVPQKNPLFLLDIFYQIAKKQADALFVLVGFGELEDVMLERINQYGIENRVANFGRTDDIKKLYNAFDAFLLPSLYEGMPVVGVEAQCSGLPIFFSKNITEETTVCDLAHYISLDESPEFWADMIIPIVCKNMKNRRSYALEVKAAGFDSCEETQRLQKYYEDALANI